MSTRAVDAHEDAEVHREPLRVSRTTVHTTIVARETANLGDDQLQTKTQQ